jgi:hypothetical protein
MSVGYGRYVQVYIHTQRVYADWAIHFFRVETLVQRAFIIWFAEMCVVSVSGLYEL